MHMLISIMKYWIFFFFVKSEHAPVILLVNNLQIHFQIIRTVRGSVFFPSVYTDLGCGQY